MGRGASPSRSSARLRIASERGRGAGSGKTEESTGSTTMSGRPSASRIASAMSYRVHAPALPA